MSGTPAAVVVDCSAEGAPVDPGTERLLMEAAALVEQALASAYAGDTQRADELTEMARSRVDELDL